MTPRSHRLPVLPIHRGYIKKVSNWSGNSFGSRDPNALTASTCTGPFIFQSSSRLEPFLVTMFQSIDGMSICCQSGLKCLSISSFRMNLTSTMTLEEATRNTRRSNFRDGTNTDKLWSDSRFSVVSETMVANYWEVTNPWVYVKVYSHSRGC